MFKVFLKTYKSFKKIKGPKTHHSLSLFTSLSLFHSQPDSRGSTRGVANRLGVTRLALRLLAFVWERPSGTLKNQCVTQCVTRCVTQCVTQCVTRCVTQCTTSQLGVVTRLYDTADALGVLRLLLASGFSLFAFFFLFFFSLSSSFSFSFFFVFFFFFFF